MGASKRRRKPEDGEGRRRRVSAPYIEGQDTRVTAEALQDRGRQERLIHGHPPF